MARGSDMKLWGHINEVEVLKTLNKLSTILYYSSEVSHEEVWG